MKKLMIGVAAATMGLSLFAKIEMGAPFTDGIVLQRNQPVRVWGKATPGSEVTVAFADAEVTTKACKGGCWKVELPAMAASAENREMKVMESEGGWFGSTIDEVTIKNVLVGEVWLASGQSNTDCPLWGTDTRYRDANGALVASMTELPLVRYFKAKLVWSVEPKPVEVAWRPMTAENLAKFRVSAVGFYYARELYLALQIPIGLVDVSWGGTNIDAWTPRSGYDGCDKSLKEVAAYQVKAADKFDAKKDVKGPISRDCQQPTVIWNGMVAALAPMTIKGFIWYQGCHNSGEPQLYCAKLHALYDGWVKEFKNPDLKMYLVQLAPYNRNWMGICQAQNKFCAEEKNAAIAVTSDVGNFYDIHPNQKEVVAKRLVVHALKRDYGFKVTEEDSPLFQSVEYVGAEAKVKFAHVKTWYIYAPNRSYDAAFELAGADGVWQPATIQNYRQRKNKEGKMVNSYFIDGATIVLKSDKVAKPVKVRYMGKNLTAGTLYNEASLPLGPFEK